MSSGLALLLLTTAMTAGCGKHEAPSPPPAVAQDPEAGSSAAAAAALGRAPASSAAPAIVVPDDADVNATLVRLSLELRKYVMRPRTVPKTFEEFLTKSQAQVPPPPAGKKYAIENQAVVLVKR